MKIVGVPVVEGDDHRPVGQVPAKEPLG